MTVQGTCDPAFAPVREAFEDNFARQGEVGAAVAVYSRGRLVVDLWGGVANRATDAPWQRDTLCLVYSATKAASALCVHRLIESRDIELDAPVATYWPEFAVAGKHDISVRMLLNHRAGLAAIRRPMPADAIFAPQRLADELAEQEPWWPPDSAHGYHAMTFGWLLGELVRRVTGRTIGRYFREEIAEPLGLDFWIGLPDAYHPRVARVRMAPPVREPSPLFRAMFARDSLTSKAFLNPRSLLSPGQANAPEVLRTEVPAANGVTNARSLAKLYAALTPSGANGQHLLHSDTIAQLQHTESQGPDLVLLASTHFGLGIMKHVDNRPDSSFLVGPSGFGHPGAGGSFGMADPSADFAMAYTMNQLGHGIFLNDRGASLLAAARASIAP